MSLIVKITLLLLSSFLLLALRVPATRKTQCFVHLSFNSTFQLINDISSGLKKLLKVCNGTAIVAFLKIRLAASGADCATLFPNNFALYLKDLKLLVFAMLLLKLAAASLD